MEVFRMEVGEEVDYMHDVALDGWPTSLVESHGEPVRTGSFVARH
jgi:hypothetical protein